MTYNITITTITTIITIVCTKWIIGSVPLQKYSHARIVFKDFRFQCADSDPLGYKTPKNREILP